MKPTADFDFDAALLEFGLPSEMMNNINRGPQHTCGLDYRIIPLDSPAIKKMHNDKDSEEYSDSPYVGKLVIGYSSSDNKMHRGHIVNYVWNPDDTDEIKYIVIMDDKTMKEVEIFPNSAALYDPDVNKKNIISTKHGFEIANIDDKFADDYDVNESLNTELSDDDNWTAVADDDVYRDAFIKEFSFFYPYKCFKYFDKKFAGEFQYAYIPLTGIHLPWLFRKIMGADDMDKFELSTLIKKFIKIYAGMTSQDDKCFFNMTMGKDVIEFRFPSEEKTPGVSSWYDLWCYAQTFKKCNILAQRSDDFEASESWVYKPNSKNFRTMIGNAINYDLIHMPEKKVLPDGTVKTIMKIED